MGLVRHLASDLRKHVIGVSANQSDRANDDYQDYREHHRVLGDVLTALLSPKLTDGFNHCMPPIDDLPEIRSFHRTVVRRRVILKYREPPYPPNSTRVDFNGTIVP